MELNQAVEIIKQQRAEIARDRDAMQRRKGEIAAEIVRLRGLPISFDDWGQYLKAEIEDQGKDWMGRLPSAILSRGSFKTPQNEIGWDKFEREDGSFAAFPLVDRLVTFGGESAFGGLCALFPERVHAVLMERITERCGGRWGNNDLPTVEERRAAIARLEQEDESLDKRRAVLAGELDALQ